MSHPFSSLERGAYTLIAADPPWSFSNWSVKGEKKNAKSHYSCMNLDDIKQLPVGDLAAENALLFLWATNPMLPAAIETMEAWGFTFKTAGTWHKKTKNGKTAFGTGYLLRSSNEPFLIGTRGKPKTSRAHRSLIEGVVRAHSQKPEEFYLFAETYMPDAKRLELFSRQKRPGWDSWGNQTEHFPAIAAVEERAS